MSRQPATMKALVLNKLKQASVQSDRVVPRPEAGEILVKVSHVALNPTDWKHVDLMGNPDSITGCDYSGTVHALGSGVSKWKVGDRVCGFTHGGKFPNKGSFAEYLVIKEEYTAGIPDGMDDTSASTYGIGFYTAAMVLFSAQGYSYPPAKQRDGWFLVSGGSTSVGLFTISLLHQLGVKIITTASPHSFDLVRSCGADHAVDYHDREAALKEIQSVTGGGVVAGLECVGGDDNFYICANAFKEGGGQLTTLTIIPDNARELRKDVKIERILLYTVFGYSFEFIPGKPPLPASPQDQAWFIDFVKRSQGDSGFVATTKANPVDLRPGGLEKINEGLDLLRENKVSGKKLVYQVAA